PAGLDAEFARATPAKLVYAGQEGAVLYTFNGDSEGRSACNQDCAEAWQPYRPPPRFKPSGDWDLILRDDGVQQLTFKSKPLYTASKFDQITGIASLESVEGTNRRGADGRENPY